MPGAAPKGTPGPSLHCWAVSAAWSEEMEALAGLPLGTFGGTFEHYLAAVRGDLAVVVVRVPD